jgi:O-antigen ligase
MVALLVFFFLYSARIVDNSLDGTLTQRSASEYLFYLWGTVLLPSAAAFSLGLAQRASNQCAFRLAMVCAVFSVFSYFAYSEFLSLAGETRGVRGQAESGFTISPLALGYVGAATLLLGLWGMVNLSGRRQRIFCLAASATGIIPILLGASRGPLVGILIAASAYALSSVLRGANRLKMSLKPIVFLFLLGAAAGGLVYTESAAVSRLLAMRADYDTGSSSMSRTELYSEAYTKFTESPLFGSHIELDNGMYPHNVFLEALMSCGLFGVLYVAVLARACVAAWQWVGDRRLGWVALLYFLFLTLNMVSGSIWGADALTMTGMFLIGVRPSSRS